MRREADKRLAVRAPLPDWARNGVLLSPDLLPRVFATLGLEDCAAALACKAWSREWKDLIARRRILRDEALHEIAVQAPRSREELSSIRGISRGIAESARGAYWSSVFSVGCSAASGS